MFTQRNIVLGLTLLSLFLLVSCGNGATEAPTPAPVATATSVPTSVPEAPATPVPEATATPVVPAEPTATSAPTNTPEPVGEKASFKFVKQLSTAEEMDDIEIALHDYKGFLKVGGDEIGITITYDPAVLTLDEVANTLAQIGYPVQQ